MRRLGAVSFLNTRPLVYGLDADPRVSLEYDVPAKLPALLDGRLVDAALIPIIDVLRSDGRYRVISDACIGCDGETMTVRVFSQIPPDRIKTLAVDGDSHTSVALATVLWREMYDRELEVKRIDARRDDITQHDSVLLIGDKVVDPARAGFAFEVDLGGAWKSHTGLPFVFAVWAAPTSVVAGPRTGRASGYAAGREGEAPAEPCAGEGGHELATILSQARDEGVAKAAQIAADEGPTHGWTEALATRYLTRCLTFKMDARHVAGANRFAGSAKAADLAPTDASLLWPRDLAALVVQYANAKNTADTAVPPTVSASS